MGFEFVELWRPDSTAHLGQVLSYSPDSGGRWVEVSLYFVFCLCGSVEGAACQRMFLRSRRRRIDCCRKRFPTPPRLRRVEAGHAERDCLRCGKGGEGDADAVDATVGGGEDFEAEAVGFDDFAGEGDVAGDLGDKAADGGGLVVLGEADRGGLVVIAGSLSSGRGVPLDRTTRTVSALRVGRRDPGNWSAKRSRRRESSKVPETA